MKYDPNSAAASGSEVPVPKLPPRTLIGYSSETNARAGDRIEFMVNVLDSGPYDADLVKIINGDALSRYADKFEVQVLDAPFAGSYEGRRQPLNLGSYVQVENTAGLDRMESFSVAGWIHPTFNPARYEAPDLENIDPFSPPTLTIGASIREQTIVSRFDVTTGFGWTLYLDEALRLVFAVGDGRGTLVQSRIDEPAKTCDWTYVMASFDADLQQINVYFCEKPYAPGDRATALSLSAVQDCSEVPQQGPLRIGASIRSRPVDRGLRLLRLLEYHAGGNGSRQLPGAQFQHE